ncbi:hypothetical protein HPP92_026690 [Vanilla planifolia]|uniref:Uncharacterized protein n=1 Tax=Vanilla planifolia TaxID=51239 RepID=A0A835PDL8_VANPL|nr:hypothetical protein HPP92_026908 [Vanilla planifolia]KAG0450568.1 hypothetical protein HPP92_026690 [Vanilla planifolia]
MCADGSHLRLRMRSDVESLDPCCPPRLMVRKEREQRDLESEGAASDKSAQVVEVLKGSGANPGEASRLREELEKTWVDMHTKMDAALITLQQCHEEELKKL